MREQKLIDICFQLVLTATDKRYQKHFGKMSQEQKAAWVADQLRGCGFDTLPCGASWGIMKDDDNNNGPDRKRDDGRIELCSPQRD